VAVTVRSSARWRFRPYPPCALPPRRLELEFQTQPIGTSVEVRLNSTERYARGFLHCEDTEEASCPGA
jgi:hypothetical protein